MTIFHCNFSTLLTIFSSTQSQVPISDHSEMVIKLHFEKLKNLLEAKFMQSFYKMTLVMN